MAEDLLSRHEAARDKAMRDLLNQGLSSGAISGAIGYSGRYGDRDMQAYVSRKCKDFDAKTKSLTTLCRDNNVVVTSGGIAIPERREVVDPAMLESNEAHRRGLIAELQRHEQECNTLSRDGLDYCGRTGDRDIDAFCRGACKDIKSRVATLVAFAKGHGVTDFPLRSSDDAASGGGIPTKAALPFGSAGSMNTAPSSASGAFGFNTADSSKDAAKGAPPAFGGFGASSSLGGFGAPTPASVPSTGFGSSTQTNNSSGAGFGGSGVISDPPCSDLTAPTGNTFGATAAPGAGKGFSFLGKEAAEKAPAKDTPADTTKVPTSFGAPLAPSASTGFGAPATKGGFGFLGKDGEKGIGKDAPTDPSPVSFGAPPVAPTSTTTGFGAQPTSSAPAGGFSFLGKDAKDTKDTEKPGATTFGASAKPAPASGAVAGGFGAPNGPSSFGAGPTAGSVSFGAPKVAPSASPSTTATTTAPSNPYQASAATPPADSARSSAFGGLKPSTGPGPFGAAPTTAPATAAKPDASSFGSSSSPFGSTAAAASTKGSKAKDVAEALTRDEKLRQTMVDDLRAKGLSDGEITQFGLNYSGKNGPRDAKSFIEGRCEGMTQRAASFAKFHATEMQPAAKSSSGTTSDDAVLNQLVKSQDARQLAVAALCRTGATLSAISQKGLLYSGKNGSRDTDKFISGGCQDLRARCGALVQYCNTMGVDLAQGKKKDDGFSAPPTTSAAPFSAPVKSVFESGQGFGGGATGAAKIPVAEAAPAPAVKIPRATASPKPTVAPKKSTPPPAPEPPKKQVPVWW